MNTDLSKLVPEALRQTMSQQIAADTPQANANQPIIDKLMQNESSRDNYENMADAKRMLARLEKGLKKKYNIKDDALKSKEPLTAAMDTAFRAGQKPGAAEQELDKFEDAKLYREASSVESSLSFKLNLDIEVAMGLRKSSADPLSAPMTEAQMRQREEIKAQLMETLDKKTSPSPAQQPPAAQPRGGMQK